MKAKFVNKPLKDFILIIAEDTEETEALSRWNNCVLTAKFDHDYSEKPSNASLLIAREI